MNPPRVSIALVDFADGEFSSVATALGRQYYPIPMSSGHLGDGVMPRADVPIVLVRSTREGEAEIALLHAVRRFFPDQHVCLVSPHDDDFSVTSALASHIWCHLILEQATADSCAQLKRVLQYLTLPLDRMLPVAIVPNAWWRHDTLISKNDKLRLGEAIAGGFARFSDDAAGLYQLRLCTEEALNNSIFHAFRNPDGSEKYRVGTFMMLAPRDRLDITFGASEETFCLAISDNAGTLDLETLFARLRYHEEVTNLFAERGRGLYLMRSYSHEAYIGVVPGKLTFLLLLFHKSPPAAEKRPLLVRFEAAPATS